VPAVFDKITSTQTTTTSGSVAIPSNSADASPLAPPEVTSATTGTADDADAAGLVSDPVIAMADALKSNTTIKVNTDYKSRDDFVVGWVDGRRLVCGRRKKLQSRKQPL